MLLNPITCSTISYKLRLVWLSGERFLLCRLINKYRWRAIRNQGHADVWRYWRSKQNKEYKVVMLLPLLTIHCNYIKEEMFLCTLPPVFFAEHTILADCIYPTNTFSAFLFFSVENGAETTTIASCSGRWQTSLMFNFVRKWDLGISCALLEFFPSERSCTVGALSAIARVGWTLLCPQNNNDGL